MIQPKQIYVCTIGHMADLHINIKSSATCFGNSLHSSTGSQGLASITFLSCINCHFFSCFCHVRFQLDELYQWCQMCHAYCTMVGLDSHYHLFYEHTSTHRNVPFFSGIRSFSDDVCLMLGKQPNIYFKVTWTFISPIVTLVSVNLHTQV